MNWSREDRERLEREGLDLVHRYAGRYPAEVQGAATKADPKTDHPPAERPLRRFFGWLTLPRLSYSLNACFAVLFITGYAARDHIFPVIPVVHVNDTSVVITEPGGEPVWSHDFGVAIEKAALAPWDRRPRQVVVATKLAGTGDATLSNWDFRADRMLWTGTVEQEELLPFFPEHNAEPGTRMRCHTFDFADLHGDGTAELVTAFRHETYFPACIRTFTQSGEILGTYFNWGYIDDVLGVDIDGDGLDEILAAGTNNAPDYQGATVILLDADHLSGHSVDPVVDRGREFTEGSLARLILPAWDARLMRYLKFERLHASDLKWRAIDGTIDFKVGLRTRLQHVYATVRVDGSLRPLRVIPHGWILTESRRALEAGDVEVDATSQTFWEDWLKAHRRFGATAEDPA